MHSLDVLGALGGKHIESADEVLEIVALGGSS